MTLKNVGEDIRYINASEPLPTSYSVGAGYTLSPGLGLLDVLVELHYIKPEKWTEYRGGLEYRINGMSFRVGYRDVTAESSDVDTNLSAGFGLALSRVNIAKDNRLIRQLEFDYAWKRGGFFEDQHLFGLTYHFPR
jgi:hypothetical protein